MSFLCSTLGCVAFLPWVNNWFWLSVQMLLGSAWQPNYFMLPTKLISTRQANKVHAWVGVTWGLCCRGVYCHYQLTMAIDHVAICRLRQGGCSNWSRQAEPELKHALCFQWLCLVDASHTCSSRWKAKDRILLYWYKQEKRSEIIFLTKKKKWKSEWSLKSASLSWETERRSPRITSCCSSFLEWANHWQNKNKINCAS